MKYKFCNIRINVIKYDVTCATKGVLTPHLPPMATPLDLHNYYAFSFWTTSKTFICGTQKFRFFWIFINFLKS